MAPLWIEVPSPFFPLKACEMLYLLSVSQTLQAPCLGYFSTRCSPGCLLLITQASAQISLFHRDFLWTRDSWALKNWCFWTVVLEKTLESPLDCKEIKPVHPKGNQSWIFIGRTDAEAEAPILWPPDVKNWLIGKDPEAGKDWRQEKKGKTEDEMVGWHHQLNGHEFELWELVMDREAWRVAVCGVPNSRTWLSDWTELKSKPVFQSLCLHF